MNVNITYLWVALGVYLISCIPMVAAQYVDDREYKTTLMLGDALATILAYVFLWAAFDQTLYSLTAVVIALIVNSTIGALLRQTGYDPYDYEARRAERKAAR